MNKKSINRHFTDAVDKDLLEIFTSSPEVKTQSAKAKQINRTQLMRAVARLSQRFYFGRKSRNR